MRNARVAYWLNSAIQLPFEIIMIMISIPIITSGRFQLVSTDRVDVSGYSDAMLLCLDELKRGSH